MPTKAHQRTLLIVIAALALGGGACSLEPTQDGAGAASPTGVVDGPATTGSYSPPPPQNVPTVGIGEALALPEGSAIGARGLVWGDAAGYRLCSALAESLPPQCAGDSVVLTEDGGDLIDQLQTALRVEGEVAWSEQEVVVWGYRRGADGFAADLAAGGSDVAPPSTDDY